MPKPDLSVRKGIQVTYFWSSPERIWKPKPRAWYLSYALLFLLLMLLFARLQQYIMIVGVIAFSLLWFVQGTIAPWVVEHKVTSRGIFTHGVMYLWDDMTYFWFAHKKGQIIFYADFPKESSLPRLTLLVNSKEESQEIFDHVIHHVKYAGMDEAEYNALARLIYGEYIPLTNFVPDLDRLENQ